MQISNRGVLRLTENDNRVRWIDRMEEDKIQDNQGKGCGVVVRMGILHLVVTSLSKRVAQPFQTFIKTIAGGSACGLDVLFIYQQILWDEGGEHSNHTQARCLRLWRPSLSVISAAFMAFYAIVSTL